MLAQALECISICQGGRNLKVCQKVDLLNSVACLGPRNTVFEPHTQEGTSPYNLLHNLHTALGSPNAEGTTKRYLCPEKQQER